MIHLNAYYCTKKKEKNKHLSKEMYEKIQSEYNHYLFSKEKECGKTVFMKSLANTIGTTLSNLYEIVKVGMITTLDYELRERKEFSAIEAWNKRNKKSVESNASKRETAKPLNFQFLLEI